MHFKLGQKIIDKIRCKKHPISNPIDFHKNILINNGYKFYENIIETPSNVLFKYDNTTYTTMIYAILEVFNNKDYELSFNKDNVFIDIGMNLGTTTLYYANKESITHIYSYEPFFETYNHAMENINLNKALSEKIETYNVGLGKKNEELKVPFNINYCGCMSTTINPFIKNPIVKEPIEKYETVKIEKASDVLLPIINKHYNKENIILKIDTEGAEFDIIENLEENNMLSNFNVIMLEWHFKSPKIIEETLIKNGFTVRYAPINYENISFGMIFAYKTNEKY